MLFDRYRYIVVEGPIGVGKTSLALRLAQHAGSATLLEKPDENPFLARFYQDPPRYALATQLFFLFQRGNEVRDLAQMDLFRESTVADYLFDKDPLFARLNLNEEEFALYQQIYRSLQLQAPVPDLVIYLQAAPETLVERVQRRAQPYESGIAESYLLRLSQSYSDFFYH
ncbi:MAG: deoxynucleoside kinase, partial [Gallionella sp.]